MKVNPQRRINRINYQLQALKTIEFDFRNRGSVAWWGGNVLGSIELIRSDLESEKAIATRDAHWARDHQRNQSESDGRAEETGAVAEHGSQESAGA